MILLKNNPLRFVSSGLLLIFICLIINVLQDPVEAAKLNKRRHVRATDKCESYCQSPVCTKQAMFFLTIMNNKVDPCDDFYEFVCGNFVKQVNIPDQMNVINIFGLTQTKVSTDLYHEIREKIKPDELSAFKKLKVYFQNCMNEDLVEQRGTKPLFDLLDKIGGWPILLGDNWKETEFDWLKSVSKLKNEKLPLFFPVILSVGLDKQNSTKTILNVLNAATTVSKTLMADGPDNKLIKAYYDFIQKTAVAFGAKDEALSEVKQIFDFEVNLYNETDKTPSEKLLRSSSTDNQFTVKQLSEKFPTIPWLELFNVVLNPNGIFIDENEEVIVADVDYILKLETLLENTPKRVLANYIGWYVVNAVLEYLPKEYQQLELDFSQAIEGTKSSPQRESRCLGEILQGFPVGLSSLYVRKYFNETIKENVYKLVQNIKAQTKNNLLKNEWMDDKTRKAAIEKLDAMGVTAGYADELMDDDKVEEYYCTLQINPGNYFESAFNLSGFLINENYRNLKEPIDKNSWTLHQSSVIVNAYYLLQTNTIEIPAGFLGGSFFQFARPEYLNYGAVGTVIGHEITHAFDSSGRKYDKEGNYRNWWEPSTEKKFLEKAQCIIDQYNNFTVPEVGLHVNGFVTQGENIADNGGFKAAYQAYVDWSTHNNEPEPCLPLLTYTPRQLFWISAASSWCSKQRPEYLKNLMITDSHSPDNSRIIVTFSNMKEFADDFDCKVGSNMNPKDKCVLW